MRPAILVWALVADTYCWDRVAGLAPGAYAFRVVDGKRQNVGAARELGFALEWVEPPYQWIEGRFVHGERQFLRGPAAGGGLDVILRDVDGGTEVVATPYVIMRSAAVAPFAGPIMRRRFRAALKRWLDAIGTVLGRSLEGLSDPREPALSRIRRALVASGDPTVSARSVQANLGELERRAERLRIDGFDPGLVDHLCTFLRERADEEVAQIRPFELARVWDVLRRDVLRLFLHATRVGLVDLRWQINCPVCRVSAQVSRGLDEMQSDAHCGACNVHFDVDFADHVEAVFQVNPALREATPRVYCAASPAFRPHIWAELLVPAGGERIEAADLFDGPLLIRTLSNDARQELAIERSGVVRVVLGEGEGDLEVTFTPGDEARLEVVSKRKKPTYVLFERGGWAADAALGSVVASFPDFLNLFATEAPASGVELSVGHLALLFTDLTGSTAMYERLGDARAFAVVEEHFQAMTAAVAEHGGAVIKTMGDAVMASFPSPVDAVAAAIAMVGANDRTHGDLGLGVKIGVHAGPCLAVRANDRLDFFGTTVNVAARLQAKAAGGELVLSEALASHPEIAARIADLPRRSFEADLKGIAAVQRLVAVTVSQVDERPVSAAPAEAARPPAEI